MFTSENTWVDIENAKQSTAVVPIGATEQHGANLPLATDTLLTEPLAAAIAEKLDAYLLPQIPFGQSECWLAYPGTVSLSIDTMKAVVADIVRSLATNGFTSIVFLSVHGGNDSIVSYLPPLEQQYPHVKLVYADMEMIFEQASKAAGVPNAVHADECEASMMLAIRPDLVGANPVDCPAPSGGYPSGLPREISPFGSFGEPSKATKAKGEAIWGAMIRIIIDDVIDKLG